jgi:AcrR family transcriptional regulator
MAGAAGSSSSSKPARPKRAVGRPRGDGKPHLTREHVFAVTAKLVAQHGFSGASTRMIAAALEASPASLFHLFGSKADLLNDMIAYAAGPSGAFYQALGQLGLPPEVALYKSVHEETRVVASADPDHAALFYLPELRLPDFAPAQAVRGELVAHYHRLIDAGCATGVLRVPHPALAAEQLFQLSETSILACGTAQDIAPDEQARATADFCLRGVLARPARLDSVRDAAAGVTLGIAMPGSLQG